MAETVQLNHIPLAHLHLRDSSLNFDFVLKLSRLEYFVTDQKLPAELIAKLIGLPLLVEIECFFGNDKIKRISSTKFSLNGKHVSLSELLVILEL